MQFSIVKTLITREGKRTLPRRKYSRDFCFADSSQEPTEIYFRRFIVRMRFWNVDRDFVQRGSRGITRSYDRGMTIGIRKWVVRRR